MLHKPRYIADQGAVWIGTSNRSLTMFGLGYPEWICIFLIVLLVFGGRKLPEVARGLAKAIHEFRKARDELHDTVKKQMEDSQTSPDTDPRESSGQDADRSDGDRVKTPPKD